MTASLSLPAARRRCPQDARRRSCPRPRAAALPQTSAASLPQTCSADATLSPDENTKLILLNVIAVLAELFYQWSKSLFSYTGFVHAALCCPLRLYLGPSIYGWWAFFWSLVRPSSTG